MPSTNAIPTFAHALSVLKDPAAAAAQITRQIDESLGSRPSLVVFNASGEHARCAGDVGEFIKQETGADHVIGCSAAGVVGGSAEIERHSAISALAASLPNVTVTPIHPPAIERITDPNSPECLASLLPQNHPHICTFLFADPASTPIASLIDSLGRAHASAPGKAVLFGGIASGSAHAGGNTLSLDGAAYFGGAVAVALSGDLSCDIAVSQGCRPVGPGMRVTSAKGNLVLRLDGKPALEVLREIVRGISQSDRKLLAGGLFLGRSIHDHKAHLGRGDFLVRNLVGADEASGGIAVADIFPEGATVRLHFRDATTATEDLELLLDAQQLHGPPSGAFLVTCLGRGERFFGKQNHDAVAVQRAFLPQESGSESAKAGDSLGPHSAPVPLAGFFAAGEIGPIGGQTFLHGYTACLACFRPREESSDGYRASSQQV